jgi:hypothetical protein
MDIRFPDELFNLTGNQSKLKYEIEHGKKIAHDKKILFCGIIRDAGDNLERNILRYKSCVQPFKEAKLFLYENDSKDNTLEVLQKYKCDKIDFVSESRKDSSYVEQVGKKEDPFHFHRCEVLSECRNKYMSLIQKNKWNEYYDFICMIDMDIIGGWSYDGFYHSIYMLDNVDDAACMSAYGVLADYTQTKSLDEVKNSQYVFYDSFAFRPINMNPVIHKLQTGYFNPILYNRGEEIDEVISNFNGLAIYKSKYFTEDKLYKTNQWKEGYVDSEHIFFHQQIRKQGGKIYLNPNLIVSYVKHKYCKDNK